MEPRKIWNRRASCSSRRTEHELDGVSLELGSRKKSRVPRRSPRNSARIIPGRKLFAVRAPGRVNLIGEHTDYSELPVMPIAIDRSTIIAASPRDGAKVELRNVDPAFSPREFLLEASIPPSAPGDWSNYVKAGNPGCHRSFRPARSCDRKDARRHDDRRWPRASGRGSFVIGGAHGFLGARADGGQWPPQDALKTAQMVARSEWYVGTMAGGMDQAASMLGRRDHAMLIHFDPLRVTPGEDAGGRGNCRRRQPRGRGQVGPRCARNTIAAWSNARSRRASWAKRYRPQQCARSRRRGEADRELERARSDRNACESAPERMSASRRRRSC